MPYGEAGQWVFLGDNLATQTSHPYTGSSLVSDHKGRPILAISTQDQTNNQYQTHVVHWNNERMTWTWTNIGRPIEALETPAALRIDNLQRIYLCGRQGPRVWRWSGSKWINLGGPIARESGHYRRHLTESCGDIILDNTNNPVVTWRLTRGTRNRSTSTYAARWDEIQQKWLRLGEGEIGIGSFTAKIDTDILNRPYLVTWHTGNKRLNSGTRTSSQFWRLDGSTWNQLAVIPNTIRPLIAINKNRPYIALTEISDQTIRVMRWQQDDWEELPSPGTGYRSQLDFTLMGKPIIAYQSTDDANNQYIQVKHFIDDVWKNLGDPVVQSPDNLRLLFNMTLDTRGRPIIAWTEYDYTTKQAQLFVKRYQHIDD